MVCKDAEGNERKESEISALKYVTEGVPMSGGRRNYLEGDK